jgi:hypothetical protein
LYVLLQRTTDHRLVTMRAHGSGVSLEAPAPLKKFMILLLLASAAAQSTTTSAAPTSTPPVVFQCNTTDTLRQPNGCPQYLAQPFTIRFFYNQTILGRVASSAIFTLRRGRDLLFQTNGTFVGNGTIQTLEWDIHPHNVTHRSNATSTSAAPQSTETLVTGRVQILETVRSTGVLHTSQYTVTSFLLGNSSTPTSSSISRPTVIIGGSTPQPTTSHSYSPRIDMLSFLSLYLFL